MGGCSEFGALLIVTGNDRETLDSRSCPLSVQSPFRSSVEVHIIDNKGSCCHLERRLYFGSELNWQLRHYRLAKMHFCVDLQKEVGFSQHHRFRIGGFLLITGLRTIAN